MASDSNGERGSSASDRIIEAALLASGQGFDSQLGLASILDHVPSAIFVQDAGGGLVYANRAAIDLFGSAWLDDIRGVSVEALLQRLRLSSEQGDPVGAGDLPGTRVLGGAPSASLLARVTALDAPGERWMRIDARPLTDQAGRFAVSTWEDVTSRRLAGERTRNLAALVTTLDDSIVSETLDGIVTSWNPAAERLFGWTAGEMVGQSIVRIVPEDKRDELADIFVRLGRGERIEHHETARVARDGRRIEVSVSISPVHDQSGRVVGAAKIDRDISVRREHERFIDAFLADLAHDLNNPLAAVRARAQLLSRRAARGEIDPEMIRDGLARIDASARGINRRIGELSDVARLRRYGEIELHRAPTDLVELTRELLTGYADQANRLVIETEERELAGDWDRDRVERVLDNLITNGLKYSPEESVVRIRIRREQSDRGPQAVVEVIDRGIGIPARDLPFVFDRYRRGGNVAARYAGSGIGLAGAKSIVDRHHGAIEIESAEGAGTAVIVRLPLADPQT